MFKKYNNKLYFRTLFKPINKSSFESTIWSSDGQKVSIIKNIIDQNYNGFFKIIDNKVITIESNKGSNYTHLISYTINEIN